MLDVWSRRIEESAAQEIVKSNDAETSRHRLQFIELMTSALTSSGERLFTGTYRAGLKVKLHRPHQDFEGHQATSLWSSGNSSGIVGKVEVAEIDKVHMMQERETNYTNWVARETEVWRF